MEIHKLRYVVEPRQGLTAIHSDVGWGKSRLVRLLLQDNVGGEDYTFALISTQSFKSDKAFLKAIRSKPQTRQLVDSTTEFAGSSDNDL